MRPRLDQELLSYGMDEALKEAAKAYKKGEVPVGAVVFREGKIIARAHNLREKKRNATSHAEIEAIVAASKKLKSWRLTECALVVTLEPCLMCLSALYQCRIGSVFFGATDPKAGALTLGYPLHTDARLNHRFSCEEHQNPECARILRDFFKERRAKNS